MEIQLLTSMEQGKSSIPSLIIYKLTLWVFLFVSIEAFCQNDSKIRKPQDERLAEAFGYLEGQKFTLEKIQSNFSHLSLSVKKASNAFSSSFGNADKNLKLYLTDRWGEKNFSDFKLSMMSKLKETLGNQELNEEDAIIFVQDVEKRAKGEISTPVLETLLNFQYLENPENEFINGYKEGFRTKGHPKSKGTDWQIKVPKSWFAEEAERPNIIQKFTSDYGDGREIIMMMVKDLGLPKNYKFSKDELNSFFSEKGAKEMVPKGATFISFKKMVLDNNIGGMLTIDQVVERLDFKNKIRMVQFNFVLGNKLCFIQFHVKSDDLTTDLSERTNKLMPLFRQVVNSLVINEQYK